MKNEIQDKENNRFVRGYSGKKSNKKKLQAAHAYIQPLILLQHK